MESIQKLRFKTLVLVTPLLLVSCSTKKVMDDDDNRFKDINEEFSQVVTIEEVNLPPAEVKVGQSPAVVPKIKPLVKTEKKKVSGKKNGVVEERQPVIEDSEGFQGRRPNQDPFREGEKTIYSLSYFGAEAGELTLEIEPYKIVNDQKAYHYSLNIQSSPRFSLFFALNVKTETFVDFEKMIPLSYATKAKEASKLREVKAYFNWDKAEATHWEKTVKKGGEEKKKKLIWNIEPYSQNILSALYYMRSFTLKPGKTVSFRVADSGKNYVFKGEVLRREKLQTEIGELDTLLIQPTFEVEGELKPTGDNLIWVTNDDRKRIVRLELKIKIGSLVAKVKSVQN